MVTICNKNVNTRYVDLDWGDWFLYHEELYIKIKDMKTVPSTYRALNIRNGGIYPFDPDDYVEKQDVRIECIRSRTGGDNNEI